MVYDQPENESFRNKIEAVQYKASLAMKGAAREKKSSKEKLSHELDSESLRSRRCQTGVKAVGGKLLVRLRLGIRHNSGTIFVIF